MDIAAKIVRELIEEGVYVYLEEGHLKYKAQRGALNDRHKQEVRNNKDGIIAYLEQVEKENTSQAFNIPRVKAVSKPERIPLSYAQQRLWFIDQLGGGSSQYNISGHFAFEGEMQISAFERALACLIERHEILRTNIDVTQQEPYQFAVSDFLLPYEFCDLSGCDSDNEKKERLAAIAQQSSGKSFNLNQDLMLRITLTKLSQREYVIIYTVHHIALDGWSLATFRKEFKALIDSFNQGKGNPLTPLSVQYSDYALWQRSWLKGDVLQQQLDYWKNVLSGIPPVHSVPLDKPRPQKQTFSGMGCTQAITAGVSAKINDLCLKHDVTHFMFLQTAFALLLARYSGSNDIVMGTHVAGREHLDENALMGNFVNTLVLRNQFDDLSESFGAVLNSSKQHILNAFKHQYVPFDMVVEELKPERSLSYEPLVQIVFAMHNDAEQIGSKKGSRPVDEQASDQAEQSARFDIGLHVFRTTDQIHCSWRFNKAIYCKETMINMSRNFAVLLESICTDEKARLSQLSILDRREQTKLLKDFNCALTESKNQVLILRQVEEQAAKHPQNIALICKGETVTYGEMNTRANQLAHHLLTLGVTKGDFVGVCFHRSNDMMIGILAAMKTGAAYVPIDAGYPIERVEHMLSDAQAKVVLTQTVSMDVLQNQTKTHVLNLDSEDLNAQIKNYPDAVPKLKQEPGLSDLMYLLYTSGSSGRPKGVLTPHGGALDYCRSGIEQYYINPETTSQVCGSLVVTSLSFGVTLPGLFIPLMQGQSVELVGNNDVLNSMWRTMLNSERGYFIRMTPSHISSLSSFDDSYQPSQHAHVFVIGGEKFSFGQYQLLRSAFPNAKIYSHYGSTEAIVGCFLFDTERLDDSYGDSQPLPVGNPLNYSKAFVLDKNGQPLPIGVPGELHVYRNNPTQGYVNDIQLTHKKYLPCPFVVQPQAKMFKMGDIARWRHDGILEVLGRADDQVNIRGHRIELGEIEVKLSHCTGIKQAVVNTWTDEHQSEHLVAYVTAKEGVELEIAAIRNQLSNGLPGFMMPSFIEILAAIPLTHNGKINKLALPTPDIANVINSAYVAPRDQVEAEMCELWQQAMSLEKVGIYDNFFSIGGHSLLGTRLINLIREKFDTEMPLEALFETPTVAGLVEKLAQGTDIFTLPPMEKADRSQSLPLSHAQMRLWFIDQLEQSSLQYNISGRYVVTGEFNLNAFEQALTSLLERHEILRTHFHETNGEPQQLIAAQFKLPLIQHDFTLLNEADKKAQVQKLVKAESTTAFDLSQDLMLRVRVIKLTNDAHIVLYTLHHIASDGWSLTVFKRELSILYRAFCDSDRNPLPALNYQYADYAVWQKNWMKGEALEQQVGYWKQQLANIPLVHGLPLDKRRPLQQTYSGRAQSSSLSKASSSQLTVLCEQHQVTPFMFLQTVFAVLLGRYSNQTDIVVGTPIAGRTHKDIEDLIGFFVNSLVLYTDLSDNPVFSDLLQINKQTILDAYAHQHVPFEMLVEAISPQRDMSHNSLFQIVFSIQGNDSDALDLSSDNGNSESFKKDSTITNITTRVDLEVHVRQRGGDLSMVWIYNDALFNDSSIARLAGYYSVLLDSVISALNADVEPGIDELVIMTKQQQQDILRFANGKIQRSLFKEQNFVAAFESNVSEFGKEIALISDGQELSYTELNTKANQLAHLLIAEGIKAGDRVALLFKRGTDMVISVLASLKVGAVYVPLEPDHPTSRINTILQDSGSQLVLSHESLQSRLEGNTQNLLCLDAATVKQGLSKQLNTPPNITIQSDELAYIIYTSGSTGVPKGVMVSHGNLMHYLSHGVSYLHKGITGSVVSSTLAFDATVCSLFIPLLVGKSIELVPDNNDMLEQLVEFISDDEENYLFKLTPAHLQALLYSDFLSTNPNACHVFIIGGEQLPRTLVKQWQQLLPAASFVNEYGPTEATVGCSVYTFDAEQGIHNDNVPIGKPIANTQMYVLDTHHTMQPLGVSGELYIGGAGIAQGYINQPELNAERFISNPFEEDQGARLYRTGDIVKMQADGQFEFVGRVDEQIKIRGFRIEPAEIEAQLQLISGVSKSLVVGWQPESSETLQDLQLVAYVVLGSDSNLNTADESKRKQQLKGILQRNLPEYMIPSYFVILADMPLTTQGKVNKKALPQPMQDGKAFGEYVAPRDQTEEKLCALWQEILKLDRVSIEDNFFTLGGHSLLATRLISAMRQSFDVELPLRTMFEFPTIASISGKLAEQSEAFVLPDIECFADNVPRPLSYAQQRLWFIDQLNKGSPQYNMVGAFLIDEDVDLPAFEKALASLLERHQILRTHFTELNGETMQVVKTTYPLKPTLHDFRDLSNEQKGAEISRIAKTESAQAFDLANDILLRIHLLKLTENMQMVMYITHHIASDGWSTATLKRELSSLYFAHKADTPAVKGLQPLPVQYADYAQWQRNWLTGDVLDSQLGYWRERLAGIPPVHSIPLDKARPAKQTYAGSVYRHPLSEEISSKINDLCSTHQTTLFIFLQTAFAMVIGRYSNAQDIVIGSAISGRNHKDVEGLIGFFVNALALRIDLSEKITFSQLLAENKRHILDAYAHQHVPFEMLVEELRPERNLSYNPLYQIMFAVQKEEQFELQGKHQLTLSSEEIDAIKGIQQSLNSATTTRFDMLVQVNERRDSLSVNWLYNEALFEEGTIKRLANFYETLLASVVNELETSAHDTQHQECSIDELTMMTAEAKQTFFTKTHGKMLGDSKNVCLHERFEDQVKLTPNRIAVSGEGHVLTYQELNEQSNKLARYLLRQEVRPNTVVALFFEHAVEMMIGIMGVLKSGAAYVPLDPNLPSARVSKILEDADASIILTQQHLTTELSAGDCKILPLEDSIFEILLDHFDGSNISRSENGATDSNLAYLIYTSGSTGEAKGVMVSHSAANKYCDNALAHYYDKDVTGSLVVTSYSVDMTLPALFVPLFCGHKVQILPCGVALEKLASQLQNTSEDYLVRFTPSHAEGLMALIQKDETFDNQHTFVIGGEALHTRTAQRLQAMFSGSKLFNHYGPTEAVVGCVINASPCQKGHATAPIGRSMDNIELYVLNERQELHLPGSVGELAVSGNRLARGYKNMYELTSEKFIANPWSNQADARMYRTGDLVRWLPDGQLMYIGRVDEQLQMRGFRIELGEVDAALKNLTGVNEAAATVVTLQNHQDSLTAYVVPEQAFDVEDDLELQQEKNRRIKRFREQLAQQVPEHFIPSIFVFLEQLPTSANGKVNKRALPLPKESDLQSEIYQAPETSTEITLGELWQEVLGLDKIGINDNFFMLGGHSLLATRFISLVRDRFEIELPLKTVFDFPTIAELSNLIEARLQNNNKKIEEKEEFVL